MEYKKHPEKQPHKRSQQAFFIGLVVALSITLVAFEWKTYTLVIPDSYDPPENLYEEEEETPVVILENKEIPKPPQPKVQKQLPAVVLDPTPKVVFQVVPSTKETEIILGDDLFPPEELEAETQLPTRFPSIQAEFNGGESALYQYLADHIKYPDRAKELGIQGVVYLQFIVNTDGTISDIEVLREQNEWLVKEAKRVVKNMPKWKPGRQGGRKVRVIFTLPIHFALK